MDPMPRLFKNKQGTARPLCVSNLLSGKLTNTFRALPAFTLSSQFQAFCRGFPLPNNLLNSFILTLVLPAQKVMEMTELKRVFQMFDRNGDGRITKKELNESLENMGIFIPDEELAQMIENIDVNGDGCVDIEEFGVLYKSIMDERDQEEEEDMMEAFNVFDQNGDGFITVDELRSVLGSLGLKQGRCVENCKKMIMKVDVDGDGMVNYKEFKQMMRGGGFIALS